MAGNRSINFKFWIVLVKKNTIVANRDKLTRLFANSTWYCHNYSSLITRFMLV